MIAILETELSQAKQSSEPAKKSGLKLIKKSRNAKISGFYQKEEMDEVADRFLREEEEGKVEIEEIVSEEENVLEVQK